MFKKIIIILLITFSSMADANNENNSTKQLAMHESVDSNGFMLEKQYQQYLANEALQKSTSTSKALGGTAVLNGHVEDTSAVNIVGHDVTLYELLGNDVAYVSSEITDANGDYSFTDLTAGTYLVFAGSQADDYVDYVWQSDSPFICNFPQRCFDNSASHINLPDAAILNNFDFSIALGGQIHGAIIDALSLAGVGTLTVELYNIDRNQGKYYFFTSGVDQATGSYSIKGIPDGDYRVYSQASFSLDNFHISQIYGGPECNLCIREIATPGIGSILTINTANNINNINFIVNIGASIKGFILDNNTAIPITGNSKIRIFGEFNRILGLKNVSSLTGSYIFGGLLAGSYYVEVEGPWQGFYQTELYNNIPCYYTGCDRGTGEPIVLTAQEDRIGVNFLLEKGGKIAGTVTDAMTNLPITVFPFESQVQFYNNLEQVVGSAFIQTDGSYISWQPLPIGTYSARTGSMFQGKLLQPYVNQKYSGIDCAGLACDLSATNIVVSIDTITTGIDFALLTGNSFSGTVTDITTSAPIAKVNVLVYKDMGAGVVKFANWATTSDGSNGVPIGNFEVTGLPDGTYFARTGYGSDLPFFVSSFHNIGGAAPIGWIDILYDGLACLADCDVTTGTPIILPEPVTKLLGTNTVDFGLNQGGIITGLVTDFSNHLAIKEITINIYNDQGVFMGSSITDNQGNYITRGLPTGTYYLTTSSFDVLLDVKYGNEICTPGICNPLDAQPIAVIESQQASSKDFILKTAYMHMFGNSFEN